MELARDVHKDPAIQKIKLNPSIVGRFTRARKKAVKQGFSAYLHQPITQSQLLNSIMRIISGVASYTIATTANPRASKLSKDDLILVAEDHAVNQQVAQLYLTQLGLRSHVVSNGREALEAISRENYVMVLMDCQMQEWMVLPLRVS